MWHDAKVARTWRKWVGGQAVPGHLKDLCRDAALVEVQEPCELGTPVRIAWAGGDGEIEVAGRVIRLAHGEGEAPAMAVLFGDVAPAAATAIELMIDRGPGG